MTCGPTIDKVDAGAGEIVLILDEGNSARQMLAAPDAPVRAMVAGVVDELVVDGRVVVDSQRSMT